MRATAVEGRRHVAVVAEDLMMSLRPALALQFEEDRQIASEGRSFRLAAAVNVVKREEFVLRLAAAGASASVGVDDLASNCSGEVALQMRGCLLAPSAVAGVLHPALFDGL